MITDKRFEKVNEPENVTVIMDAGEAEAQRIEDLNNKQAEEALRGINKEADKMVKETAKDGPKKPEIDDAKFSLKESLFEDFYSDKNEDWLSYLKMHKDFDGSLRSACNNSLINLDSSYSFAKSIMEALEVSAEEAIKALSDMPAIDFFETYFMTDLESEFYEIEEDEE